MYQFAGADKVKRSGVPRARRGNMRWPAGGRTVYYGWTLSSLGAGVKIGAMGRFLNRFAFTFLILGGFLAFEGYELLTKGAQPSIWQVALYFIGAGMSLGIAVRGIRERHRQRQE